MPPKEHTGACAPQRADCLTGGFDQDCNDTWGRRTRSRVRGSTQLSLETAQVGANLATSGRNQAFSAEIAQLWPTAGRCWPKSGRLLSIFTEFGRSRPEFNPSWPRSPNATEPGKGIANVVPKSIEIAKTRQRSGQNRQDIGQHSTEIDQVKTNLANHSPKQCKVWPTSFQFGRRLAHTDSRRVRIPPRRKTPHRGGCV